MKKTLKNSHIYFPVNNNVVSDSTPVYIDFLDKLDLSQYNKVVTINGSQRTFNTSFTLTKQELSSGFINLEITLVNKHTGDSIVYIADTYPVTRAFVLGKSFDECYPGVITNILSRLNFITNKLNNLDSLSDTFSKSILSLESETELLGKAIKELKEEGELV